MAGNSIGTVFTLTTFGESHGEKIGGILDGCPPAIPLSEADMQVDLERRRPGKNKYVTQRQESDVVKIVSGVFEGQTTGTPIGILIENTDQKSKDYDAIKHIFRPGHADYTYQHKYGIRDWRGGGRSSARETAIRVAAGSIAKKVLQLKYGITIKACVSSLGDFTPSAWNWDETAQNMFFWPCLADIPQLEERMNRLRKSLDSVGALVHVEAHGVPVGFGEPIFDRLDADIAKAMLSINASKGVEFGDGFSCVQMKGSEHRDAIGMGGFVSNHAGGILGGISNGQPLVCRVAFKPTSSIPQPIDTLTEHGTIETLEVHGRHDPCVGIRAVPIVEAMLALTLCDHAMRHKAQCVW
ncbi:MAG: chorismate synthase [Methylacidiphilales bacterium]|nr:chorismate synthase [Candidatus Methylacidiphilales bacterium]